jgi:hypothetical protein
VEPVIETSLAEVFSGDVPRIDTASIFPGGGSVVGLPGSLGPGGVYSVGDTLVTFNLLRERFRSLVDHFDIADRSVLLVRTADGFRAECGTVPESFQGTFPLKERVTFQERGLPVDDRVSPLVDTVKKLQSSLDSGIVGTTRYVTIGNLWATVSLLNTWVTRVGPGSGYRDRI